MLAGLPARLGSCCCTLVGSWMWRLLLTRLLLHLRPGLQHSSCSWWTLPSCRCWGVGCWARPRTRGPRHPTLRLLLSRRRVGRQVPYCIIRHAAAAMLLENGHQRQPGRGHYQRQRCSPPLHAAAAACPCVHITRGASKHQCSREPEHLCSRGPEHQWSRNPEHWTTQPKCGVSKCAWRWQSHCSAALLCHS